jgi:AraC family transcriptional regulator
MQLLIKNMVCDRCVRVVREDLENVGLKVSNIGLGFVEIEGNLDKIHYKQVQNLLLSGGFELIENHQLAIVEHIKRLIINEIHYSKNEKPLSQNFSDFLVKHIGHEYYYLSTLFSTIEKTTIERYIIAQKIERTKELLFNGELTLSEIAWSLEYSSVAHLSNQFKQVMGITPSEYKRQKSKKRLPLDEVNKDVTIM